MCKKLLYLGFACVALSLLVLYGCGKNAHEGEKIVATINGEPLYEKDFIRSFALNFKKDPNFKLTSQTIQDQLDVIIDRRLLIQDARKKKLDQTDKFVGTIQTFWEQTLIRDLMAFKDKEVSVSIPFNDSELMSYYKKLNHRKTFQVVQSENKEEIDALLTKSPDMIEWQETIGPCTYDDLGSDLTRQAFEIPAGSMALLVGGEKYYIFYVKEDAAITVPPYNTIKDDIKVKIMADKKQKMMNSWLESIRNSASVKINDGVLKEVERAHE